MEPKEPKGPICQSCVMPMEKPEDFGTEADGSRNEEYCRFCYRDGGFTDPDITMEQMINKLVGMATSMEMSEEQARAMANAVIPGLKVAERVKYSLRPDRGRGRTTAQASFIAA